MRWPVAILGLLVVACVILIIVLMASGVFTPAPPETETPAADETPSGPQWITTDGGLQYMDVVVGEGPPARAGQHVEVLYEGRLTNGTVFDSNRNRSAPFDFELGAREVIRGWDVGVAGMRVGGKRELKIPAAMGYGERGSLPRIPPNAALEFTVELLAIR